MRIIIRTCFLCFLLNSGVGQAAEWKIDPTLSLKAGYNDNLRMAVDDEISSAEATFSPSAVFSVATPRSGASGNVRFDFRRFEDDSNLDDNNSRFQLNSFHNLEKSRLGLDLGFIKDTTLDSQLEATGLAFDRIRRQSITASPNWSYSFNQRTRLSANYSYRDVAYKNAEFSGFVDFSLNSAQVSLARVLNERATTTLSLSRTQSTNDNDVDSTNTNLQVSTSYQFNQTLSTSLSVGIRRTETDFSQTSQIFIFSGNTRIGFIPVNQDISNSNWASTFSASVTKTFVRGETTLSTSRNISNDINGRPIEVTRLSSINRYRFSETLSARLLVEFYKSEADNAISNRLNREYVQMAPSLSWKLKKFWSLSGSYRYRKQSLNNTSDDATQNAAYLTLTYLWPRIAISR